MTARARAAAGRVRFLLALAPFPAHRTAIVTSTPRPLPPRRLLAAATAFALASSALHAAPFRQKPAVYNGSAAATPTCPLGSFSCPARPLSYAMCRPNAMLDFYDPSLTQDVSQRETAQTYVDAAHADSSNKTYIQLDGDADQPDVRLQRADQLLQAHHLDYNSDTTEYDARGNVRYQEAGQLMSASQIRGNTQQNRGVADKVSYQMLASHGNGTAEQGVMLDPQHTRYLRATYSTCDVGHHLWEVRAKNIVIDKDKGVGTARSATVRFAGVPFLYAPYFRFPLDDRRETGFLAPTAGSNSRSGFYLGTPFYLNLAPNYDATIEPRYYSKRGTMAIAQGRYLFAGSRGELDAQFLPNDKGSDIDRDPGAPSTEGRNRFLLKFTDTTALWPGWLFSTNINRVSDKLFLRDFGNDLYTAAVGQLASNATVYGSGTWWSASFGATAYQNTDPSLPDTVVQYKQLPRATFNMNVPLTHVLEFGAKTEAVAFRKDDVVEGNRLDLYPYLQGNLQGPAWFVRPRLAFRYTGYDLTGGYDRYGYFGRLAPGLATPFTSKSPSRSVPIVSLDSGLVFDRNASLFGSSYTQTLEPRLYYLYVPYRNQDNLPLFDTTFMSFDTWQLFTPNRFSGADRQMNANNLSGALTTRLLDDGGVERLSATFGQIRYFTPQRVQLPNSYNTTTPGTDFSGSNYVVELNMQLNDRWRINSAYQWDPNNRQTALGLVQFQRRVGADGIVNFSYRFRRGLLEQYDASVVYPVSDRWRLVGQWAYSERDQRTVQAMAGVQYEGCCVKVSLLGRHYVTGYGSVSLINARTDNAVMLQFELKGLGNLTGAGQDDLLRRGILGYQ